MGIQRWGTIDMWPEDDGEFVSFTDHERVVGELDRLVRNVEMENEFLSHALAESRTEVDRILGYEVSPLAAKNSEMRTEIEELKKDAERYRWLRSHHGKDDGEVEVFIGNESWAPGHLDAQIDAAMKEQAE